MCVGSSQPKKHSSAHSAALAAFSVAQTRQSPPERLENPEGLPTIVGMGLSAKGVSGPLHKILSTIIVLLLLEALERSLRRATYAGNTAQI